MLGAVLKRKSSEHCTEGLQAWQQQCAAQAHASSSDEESNEIPADHAYCQLLKLTHHLPRNRSRACNVATARSDTAAPACAAPSGNGA